MAVSVLRFLPLLALLAGCSLTVPVRGRFVGSGGAVELSGDATSTNLDGSGAIRITASDGRMCSGTFRYANAQGGTGAFACQDGTTGTLAFANPVWQQGTGWGTTSRGEQVRFGFGGYGAGTFR